MVNNIIIHSDGGSEGCDVYSKLMSVVRKQFPNSIQSILGTIFLFLQIQEEEKDLDQGFFWGI